MMSQKTIQFRVTALFIGILFAVYTLFALVEPQKAHAQVFGGLVGSTVWCTCSSGYVMYVGPPVPGAFWVSPGSIIFPYFSPYPGHWVLGYYLPGLSACFVWAGKICVPIPNQGTVTMVGTS